jgi:CO/xanthine dehydrogenase Mo-binding subunit
MAVGEQYRYIGKPTPRKDGLDIVTGRAKFVKDLSFPTLLHGKVLRSPHPHALIRQIDPTKARTLRGVRAVLTYENAPFWQSGMPPHVRVLDRKVRFVGDGVALVAAETEEIAEEAVRLITVDYELLPAVYDVEEAMKPGAPQLYDQFPGNEIPPGCPWMGPNALSKVVIGDTEEGFKEADIVVEGAYAYENIPNPLPPEPPVAIAAWEDANNLTIWSATQGPYMIKAVVPMLMGFISIRSIAGPCGGSYGTKGVPWQVIFPAAALAKVTGTPVRFSFTKKEHQAAFALRLGSRVRAKVGMKKDGTVTAFAGEWLINGGYYSDMIQGQVAVACGEAQLMVRCPNWALNTKIICTNRNASGVVRGYGGQELKCAFIPMLTMAMEKAGMDPVEFFKKNYVKPGDGYYWRDGNWWNYRGTDYTRAMDKGTEVFGWKDKWKGWLQPSSVSGSKRRGVGVGVHGNADVGEDVSEAYVRLDPDGKATIYSCFAEHGTGQRSNLCKMVAEVLNLPLERVSMVPADSLITPFEFGPAGSRGTYTIGAAVTTAAEDAKGKLFVRASSILNVPPEALETEDGMVLVKGKLETRMPWIMAMGYDHTCLGHGKFEPDFSLANFMMVFTEVEVDTETGKVDLIRVVGATDVGQIIDPLLLKTS